MKMRIKLKNKIYEVKLSEQGEGEVRISVNGRGFVFKKKNGGEKKSRTPAAEAVCRSKKEVRAPITGTVSKIFIKEGDEVACGQKVLNLSAMKMENEILSEAAGKIKKINFKEGQLVKANDLLIELE